MPNFAALLKRVKLLFGMNPSSVMVPLEKGWKYEIRVAQNYTMRDCVQILETSNFIPLKRRYIQRGRIIITKKYSCRGSVVMIPDTNWFISLRLVHYILCLIVPPFRPTIYIVATTANKED